jgi:tetratricopeptide (TPR) repeat protein
MVAVVEIAYPQVSSDYVMMMTNQKQALNSAVTEKDFAELAVNFERIANSATDKWHPLYYAALCFINKSFVGADNAAKDADLDNAQNFVEKALEINPEESEILVLQGLIYQGRIQIDPIKRGKDFSLKANLVLKKAAEIDPENPRAYYLQGLNILHTPKMFGGGLEAACPLFEKANEKFAKHIPANILSPSWGGEECANLYQEKCHKTGNTEK